MCTFSWFLLWTGRRGLSAGDGSVAPGLLRTPPPATRGAAGCNVRFVSIMGGGRAARGARASPSEPKHVTERVPRRRGRGFAGWVRKSGKAVFAFILSLFSKSTFLPVFPGLSGRNRVFRSVGGGDIPPPPTDHSVLPTENPICSNLQGLGPRRPSTHQP